MKINNKLLGAAAAAVIVTGALAAVATAANNGSSYPPIVQKLADKFHLNPADVQGVFTQNRQDMQAKHQAKIKASLDQAVKDGKLTQDQENKLIAELQKLHDERIADKAVDRQKTHDELSQWAKDNGINNLESILPHPNAGMRHGMMGANI